MHQPFVLVNRPDGQSSPDRTPRPEIDPAVAAAAFAGDSEAFVAVLRHYDRALKVVAWHALRDRHEMDDALQEVALRAWRGRAGFRGEASPGTWLLRIARNVCWDQLDRRQRRAGTIPLDDGASPPVADHVDGVIRRDALESAFASLSPEQRLTVLLVDREGYDYTTTAAIMDVPNGTVASRLAAGREALRRALTPSMRAEVKR